MRKSLLTVAFGLAMLSLTAAHAQGAQGYVGGGLGWGNISVDCSGVSNCDKSNSGGKLYGGYRFASQLAVEAVYINWGKVKAQSTELVSLPNSGRAVPLDSTVPIMVTVDGQLKASGLGIGLAYFMPFTSDWNGVARLGVMRTDGKITGTGSAKGLTYSESTSRKSTLAYFGIGVGYNLTPSVALTGEADFSRVKYGLEGEYETDNVRLISLGVRYSF
ncbi:MAG: outer membrane beta-barrel protein [Rubrivivax sp.]|nr:outer membrane beta-barrel protein [Rubrivivax sp.]